MKLIYQIASIIVFIALLGLIISYARGYRIDFKKQSLTPTGIISISAFPRAAKVYVNGQLKGISDINLTLPPGVYDVEVKKDGYTGWKKSVRLKGELVLILDVLLYPLNSSLSPLTNLSVNRAIPIAQSDKVLLFSENDDELKDGIYLFETNNSPLSFFPPLKLIVLKKNLANVLGAFELRDAGVEIPPDMKEAIFSFNTLTGTVSYLLALDKENLSFFDISNSKDTIVLAWLEQKEEIKRKILEAFPKEIAKVASDSFRVIEFSPDESKLLYKAKQSVSLPQAITPPLIAVNQTPEERDIQINSLYVYDRKEDRNYSISNINENCLPTGQAGKLEIENCVSWYSDSKHLVINEGKKISIVDYDGQNKQTVYSGNFDSSFFKVVDGKVLILTNLNPEANKFPDLYAIGIR